MMDQNGFSKTETQSCKEKMLELLGLKNFKSRDQAMTLTLRFLNEMDVGEWDEKNFKQTQQTQEALHIPFDSISEVEFYERLLCWAQTEMGFL